MRDRLIELLDYIREHPEKTCPQFNSKNGCKGCKYEQLDDCYSDRKADYLLENGVLVPPCKINDDLWWFDEKYGVQRQEKAVRGIMFDENGKWYVADYDKNFDEVGTQYAYTTREEAEQALKGGEE